MLKKLAESIRHQSLKFNWFSRAVADYRLRLKAEHLLSAIFRGGSVKL